jgi:hypothetical protein
MRVIYDEYGVFELAGELTPGREPVSPCTVPLALVS